MLIFSLQFCKKKINPALNRPLLKAIKTNNFNKVKKLVSKGADVNANVKGLLPLIEAANQKNLRIVKFLLAEGAKVNLRDKDGDSALIVAALKGSLPIVRLLLKHGADINRANKKGRTALIYAVYGKHAHVVKYLLEKGADVLHKDKTGETATTMAIQRKSVSCLKLVMKYGAAITRKHIILTYKLHCKPIKRGKYFEFKFHKRNPNFDNALNAPYLIIKNINYGKGIKIVHNEKSIDGQKKAVAYSNGVIKIYDLKTGKFIKAFGNLRNLGFKYEYKYYNNFLYIDKNLLFVSFLGKYTVDTIYYYLNKKAKENTPSILAFWKRPDFGLLNIKNEKFKLLNKGPEDCIYISNTGKYYVYEHASRVMFTHFFKIYNAKTRKLFFGEWPVINSNNYMKSKFSGVKYTGFKFSSNDKFLIAIGYSSVFVFNVDKRKLVKYKTYNDYGAQIESVKFLNNNTTVKVTYKNKATRWLKFR